MRRSSGEVKIGKQGTLVGITVLLVSHDMGLMTVARTVHTLYFGEIIASGDMAAIQRDPRVREVYLGV